MSFKFQVLRDTWSKDRQQRELHEVRLFEVSAVAFPAYAAATVGVHSEGRNSSRSYRQRRVRQLRVEGVRRKQREERAPVAAVVLGRPVVRRGMSSAERRIVAACGCRKLVQGRDMGLPVHLDRGESSAPRSQAWPVSTVSSDSRPHSLTLGSVPRSGRFRWIVEFRRYTRQ
jgi:hypothetical protein